VSECLSRPTDADLTLEVDDAGKLFVDILRRETSPECVTDDVDVDEDEDWPVLKYSSDMIIMSRKSP